MPPYIKHYLALLNVKKTASDLDYISQLQQAHLMHFCFSSANVLLKKPLSLEPEALFERVITERTGGYCFEHNKIFYLTLKALGYQVRPILARVMLNGDPLNGLSHRLTLLTLAGQQYAIDVGFGVDCPRSLIELTDNHFISEQEFAYQLKKEPDNSDGFRLLQLNTAPEKTLYRFDLREVTEADCDIAHFYSHQHPDATFVNHLVIARIEAHQRHLIRNLHYSQINHQTGERHELPIESAAQLLSVCTSQLMLNIDQKASEHLFDYLTMRIS